MSRTPPWNSGHYVHCSTSIQGYASYPAVHSMQLNLSAAPCCQTVIAIGDSTRLALGPVANPLHCAQLGCHAMQRNHNLATPGTHPSCILKPLCSSHWPLVIHHHWSGCFLPPPSLSPGESSAERLASPARESPLPGSPWCSAIHSSRSEHSDNVESM